MSSKHIFNLMDGEFQFWKPFKYKGVMYTFEHLSATKHIYIHPIRDESYTIFITISHHVFTVQPSKSTDSDEPRIYPHKPKDKRAFCPNRYLLSFELPQILKTLPKQFCYHGGYSRYCTSKLKDGRGNSILYQVVFRVWKQRGKMRLHVESAYPLLDSPSKVKKVDFWVICHNLLKNKTLPKPYRN